MSRCDPKLCMQTHYDLEQEEERLADRLDHATDSSSRMGRVFADGKGMPC